MYIKLIVTDAVRKCGKKSHKIVVFWCRAQKFSCTTMIRINLTNQSLLNFPFS